ncbi:MAG: phosphoribosylglycinamide formyltransferase [Clostridia bacterium]|nr:phosphoribosylglycinamide formyltransferase [Clostridia bacterium]
MEKIKVAVLVSGGGTNLGAILKAVDDKIIQSAEIDIVISNKSGVYALERAKAHGVDSIVIDKKALGAKEFEKQLVDVLESRGIGLIVLAGFMCILSEDFTKRYPEKIINVHPALIPSFCGKGYYGLKVHEEALNYGVKVTGATVHFVNEIPDGGKIIAQKAVEILDGDTPEILQKRVMENAEWIILPRAVESVAKDMLKEKN